MTKVLNWVATKPIYHAAILTTFRIDVSKGVISARPDSFKPCDSSIVPIIANDTPHLLYSSPVLPTSSATGGDGSAGKSRSTLADPKPYSGGPFQDPCTTLKPISGFASTTQHCDES